MAMAMIVMRSADLLLVVLGLGLGFITEATVVSRLGSKIKPVQGEACQLRPVDRHLLLHMVAKRPRRKRCCARTHLCFPDAGFSSVNL